MRKVADRHGIDIGDLKAGKHRNAQDVYDLARARDGFGMNESDARNLSFLYAVRAANYQRSADEQVEELDEGDLEEVVDDEDILVEKPVEEVETTLPPPVKVEPREDEGSVLGFVTRVLQFGVDNEKWAELVSKAVEHSFKGDWDKAAASAARYKFNLEAWKVDSGIDPNMDRVGLGSPRANEVYELARSKDGFDLGETDSRTLAIFYALRTMFHSTAGKNYRINPKVLAHASEFLETVGFFNTYVSVDRKHPSGYKPTLLDRLDYQVQYGFKELAAVQLAIDLSRLWTSAAQISDEANETERSLNRSTAKNIYDAVDKLLDGKFVSAARAHQINWSKLPNLSFKGIDNATVQSLHHLVMVALLKEAALSEKGAARSEGLGTAWRAMQDWNMPPENTPHREMVMRYAYDHVAWDIVWQSVSVHEQELVENAFMDLPSHGSMIGVHRLVNYLIHYWNARGDTLLRDKDGVVERDYGAILANAERHIKNGKKLLADRSAANTNFVCELLAEVSEAAKHLDGDKVNVYAPGLKEPALNLVQALHDLARAIILYKASALELNSTKRLEMLTSEDSGARGAITSALKRFGSIGTPQVIRDYATLVELKIDAEVKTATQDESENHFLSPLAQRTVGLIGQDLERFDFDLRKGAAVVASGLATYWGEIASSASTSGVGMLSAHGLADKFESISQDIADDSVGQSYESVEYIWLHYQEKHQETISRLISEPISEDEQMLLAGLHAMTAAYVMKELKRFPSGTKDQKGVVGAALSTVKMAEQYFQHVGAPESVRIFRNQLESAIMLKHQRLGSGSNGSNGGAVRGPGGSGSGPASMSSYSRGVQVYFMPASSSTKVMKF
jgi:hypothetical protein